MNLQFILFLFVLAGNLPVIRAYGRHGGFQGVSRARFSRQSRIHGGGGDGPNHNTHSTPGYGVWRALDVFPGSNLYLNASSNGGGRRVIVPKGKPFAGREIGGGVRAEIYGTARYGSGYPYRVGDDTHGVAGQPFPFGVWPINWAGTYHTYGGSEEYANANQRQRIGGDLVARRLVTGFPGWNTTGNEEYWMIGDYHSVGLLAAHLSSNDTCKTALQTSLVFDETVPIHPGNIMQWYRASSFALASANYNNIYAYAPLNMTDESYATPLSEIQLNSPFLQCLNRTIGNVLPILDAPPPCEIHPATIIFPIIGVLILLISLFHLYRWRRNAKSANTPATEEDDSSTKEDDSSTKEYKTSKDSVDLSIYSSLPYHH